MSAHALPSDIIYKIACDAVYLLDVDKWEFKKGLKLLAVCQEWRRASLPVIYKYAYISSSRDEKAWDDNYDSIHELAENQSAVTVDTNVDLFQSQNCVEFVRKLNVCVHYKVLPFLGHAKIANILSTASAIWPNVHTLKMVMYTFTYGSTYKDIGSHTTVISDIVSRFTQLLPNVRCLMFQGNTVNPMAQIFYGNIADAYNNQLEKLTSKHTIVVPTDLIFTKLKHVDIWFDDITDYQPPSMNPCVLESLNLFDVFGTKYWGSFCTGEQSNEIRFSNLKKLHVNQHQRDTPVDMNHNAYQMHFPCLQKLIIDSYTNIPPWFFTAVLPTAMKNLNINAMCGLFTIPELFVFPVVENLELTIGSSININRADLLLSVNRILANTNESSNVDLTFLGDSLVINPRNIHCNSITKLCVCGPMTIDKFYAYFAKMTKLVDLTCRRLIIDENTEEAILPEPGQLPDANDMPLNICTETVEIEFRNPGDKIEKMTNIVYYLLLKLPNLTELTATDIPEDQVIEFISDYKNIYPYLPAVSLSLKTPNDYITDDYDTYY